LMLHVSFSSDSSHWAWEKKWK